MVNSNVFPSKINGTMERTMENLIIEAKIVHDSRRFLCFSPVKYDKERCYKGHENSQKAAL